LRILSGKASCRFVSRRWRICVSGVYAMFDPVELSRSLGIYTMLLVIDTRLKRQNFLLSGLRLPRKFFLRLQKTLFRAGGFRLGRKLAEI
jgi:hypothetical protein